MSSLILLYYFNCFSFFFFLCFMQRYNMYIPHYNLYKRTTMDSSFETLLLGCQKKIWQSFLIPPPSSPYPLITPGKSRRLKFDVKISNRALKSLPSNSKSSINIDLYKLKLFLPETWRVPFSEAHSVVVKIILHIIKFLFMFIDGRIISLMS